MYACGLDVGRKWMRLVLTSDYPESAPEFVEAQRFPRSVDPKQVTAQIDAWSDRYGGRPEAIVCSSTDAIPDQLLVALERQDRVEWVDGLELRRGVAVWRSTLLDRQWLRGGVTSLLFSSPMAYRSARDTEWKAAWDWRYAQLRRLVLDVEALLMGEGRILCPGHLGPICPECRAWDDADYSLEDVPF